MANVIKKSTNKWTKGLVLDFSPENTSNEVLTHALNATLVTFNGNELSLQNDMGNARVETAYLPEGYIPVGTCEYGGIIYIVSYNPLENKSQIGCFPSPERNVSSDELGELTDSITKDDFINSDYSIKNASKQIILKRDPLNPGDKYIITANDEIYQENLYNLYTDNGNGFELQDNPFIALNIVSIEDSGKITYLDSDVVMYENGKYKYHILGSNFDSGTSTNDIDQYRTITSSGYNVFKSKISGKLAILAELIMVDSYSVTHKIEATSNPNEYDIILDIETSSEDTYQKYNIVPQLSYYYLEQSQGYIPFYGKPEAGEELDVVGNDTLRKMFDANGSTEVFDSTSLSDIGYKKFTEETLSDVIKTHNFPKPSTYHEERKMLCKAGSFYRFIKDHMMDSDGNLYEDFADETFYIYLENKEEFQPIPLDRIKSRPGNQILFIKPTKDLEISYIETYKYDCGKFDLIITNDGIEGRVKESQTLTNTLKDNIRLYNKLHFANITLDFTKVNKIPFKYEYKIVPCMAYGKLNHLAVSNSINFEHINDFGESKFNTWKYRVDGDQLRLTVGAEVYDTNAADGNVVGIVLEFYDYRGFAGSLIFQNRNSYSGEFTKLITLNALGALSTQKLEMNDHDGHFVTDYQRHISIQKNDDYTGMLDGKKVEWDANKGWRYENGDDLELNDCGTLYPNLVYGVIPYFLQKGSNDAYVVSKKDQMFLFTSTLLNEHYYTCRNFNLLQDHKLDIVLTYKIDDQSSIESYENESLPDSNPNALNQYLSGNYSEQELHAKKYLQYVGTSKLQLEIGLKEDYKNIGLYNSPEINNYFTCTLQLMNDKGKLGYDVKSNDSNLQTIEEIVGYDSSKWGGINYIEFDQLPSILHPKTEYIITDFAQYNFISNPSNTNAIKIPYCFTVGHQVDITDIKDTRIPATTVCALCHKRDDGTYNYDDFGIYEVDTGDNTYYLSNTIVYNAGDSETERLGIYKQIGVQDQLSAQCERLYQTECKAVSRTRAGNLGSGNNLSSLVNSIGKLSFCLPHAHGSLDSEEGWPNIYNQGLTVDDPYAVADILNLGRDIDPDFKYETNKVSDIAKGIYPVRSYYYAPRYNSCLLTQSCVDHQNEFISTMDINVLSEGKTILFDGTGGNDEYADPIETDSEIANLTQCSEFIGFSGNQLATYNKKLLQTMKMVYAYNPDYDYLTIKAGNVNIKDTQCKFTSHLLSKSAVLNIPSLTNYLYFGQYPVATYLEEMDWYSAISVKDSDNNWVPQLNFKEDLTYCGESNPALLTTLTYNIPKPESMYNELTYSNNDEVIVRKQDGSISRVKGQLNKYALYGYHNDSLVQLDVSNYTIDNNGLLDINENSIIYNSYDLTNVNNIDDKITLGPWYRVGVMGVDGLGKYQYYKEGKGGAIFWAKQMNNSGLASIRLQFYSSASLKAKFTVKLSCLSLDKDKFGYPHNSDIPYEFHFVDQSYEALYDLFSQKSTVDLIKTDGTSITYDKQNGSEGYEYAGLTASSNIRIGEIPTWDDSFELTTSIEINSGELYNYMDIYVNSVIADRPALILVEYIQVEITNIVNRTYPEKEIISTSQTSKYAFYTDDSTVKYELLDMYKQCAIIGTSITLNDLQYIPNPTGHRLYMKPNLVKYDTSVNNKIYYRYENENPGTGSKFGGVKTADCTYNTTKDLNCLYLFTGPCFTPDTL